MDARARAQEGERGRGWQRMAEQSGKMGITIDCKSLDKRPGIVKTRSSILILYVASRRKDGRSDKGQKSTRVAVFNSSDDCRHLSAHSVALFMYHRNAPEIHLSSPHLRILWKFRKEKESQSHP